MLSPLPQPLSPNPACTKCAGSLAAAAPLAWATTVVADNNDQLGLEAKGYPLRPHDLPRALDSLPTGEAVGSQLPVPPG